METRRIIVDATSYIRTVTQVSNEADVLCWPIREADGLYVNDVYKPSPLPQKYWATHMLVNNGI